MKGEGVVLGQHTKGICGHFNEITLYGNYPVTYKEPTSQDNEVLNLLTWD